MSHTPAHIIQQQQLQAILNGPGSAAMTKNSYGVTIVDDDNISTNLLYKTLQIDNYDQSEIQKAIDLEIKELKPVTGSIRLDLVPRPQYEEQVALVNDLRLLVASLQNTISQLESTVLGLKGEVDASESNRLNTEITNDAIVNQLDALSDTVDDSGQQISVSIQKSIEESILRTSLQAQNEGFKAQINTLIKQIDSLNAIIEGLQAQLGTLQQQKLIEDSATNQVFSFPGSKKVNDVIAVGPTIGGEIPAIPSRAELFAAFNGDSSGASQKWVRGGTLKFNNSDIAPVAITIAHTGNSAGVGNWLTLSQTSFSIDANGSKSISLDLHRTPQVHGLESHKKKVGGGYRSSKTYKPGVLTITATRANGTSAKSVAFTLGFIKAHPNTYNTL